MVDFMYSYSIEKPCLDKGHRYKHLLHRVLSAASSCILFFGFCLILKKNTKTILSACLFAVANEFQVKGQMK